MEQRLNCSFKFHEMNSRVLVPFEINQALNTPVSNIDPNLKCYTETKYLQNLKYDFYLEKGYQCIIFFILTFKVCLSITMNWIYTWTHTKWNFHLLLSQKLGWVKALKNSMVYITRMWWNDFERVERKCYIIHKWEYSLHHKKLSWIFRMWNGISLHWSRQQCLPGIFQYHYSNCVPDAWFLYWCFNDHIANILNKVNMDNKHFYMLGDLNIDLLKCEEHRLTSTFLDIPYSNNVFLLIIKPTRVTQNNCHIDWLCIYQWFWYVGQTSTMYIMYRYIRPLCCISYCWQYYV